jgi:hypothetical protein
MVSTGELLRDYFLVYLLLIALQPPGLFFPDGRPREFGLEKDQTVLPAWLLAVAAVRYLHAADL